MAFEDEINVLPASFDNINIKQALNISFNQSQMKKKGFFKTVLLTGLFVGTTDLVYAYISQWIQNGQFAGKMLNYIAAAAIGVEHAFPGNGGDNAVALLGLFFHYFIAFSFTLFFFWIFPRVRFLRYNKYLIGILYAVFVNLVFEQVILPFFRLPRFSFNVPRAYINWVIFGIIFGIPIAYNAYRYYQVNEHSNEAVSERN